MASQGAGQAASSVFGARIALRGQSVRIIQRLGCIWYFYTLPIRFAVGNLSYDLSEQDMISYFSQVGPVKAVRCVRSGCLSDGTTAAILPPR